MLRYLLLALLRRDAHGYELKAAFETLLAGTWRLNVGQVYRELARLEGHGFVQAHVVEQQLLPDRKVYRLTPTGRKQLADWLAQPNSGVVRLRDDLFFKIILQWDDGAATTDTIWRQRDAHRATMADIHTLRSRPDTDSATRLLLDGILFRLKADLRWLDHCEQELEGPT